MLHQKEDAEARQKALQKAMGDPKEFVEKVSYLKNRWSNVTDSNEARLMGSIFVIVDTSPFYAAIISDNLDSFQEVYAKTKVTKDDSQKALARACLCGSQKVAEFLLKELKLSYLSAECNYMLGYVSASNNIEWVKNIATLMAQAGMKMPRSVYGLATNDEIIDIVSEIFEKNKPKNTKPGKTDASGAKQSNSPK